MNTLSQNPKKEEVIDEDIQLFNAVFLGQPAPQIVSLEAQLREAQLTSNVAVLGKLISEDLLFTGHDGQLGTKEQDLEAHRSGFFRFRSHQPEELRISWVRPDVAISSLRTRLCVEVAGSLVEGTFRYTRVWSLEADSLWRVVGGHVSQVQSP